MPKRWIEFPDNVVFLDPFTNKELLRRDGSPDIMSFGEFLHQLMHNPIWAEGYTQAVAQDAIMSSYKEALSSHEPGMWLAEEDWKLLEKTAREPRSVLISGHGAQIVTGFGRHPSMARQFLPLQNAIIQAKTEMEKLRADEARKKTG